MQSFTLSIITLGVPLKAATFDADGEANAIWFGRGYVRLRTDLEIGARYRLDRVLIRRKRWIMDDTTFVAECEVVDQDGEVGTIWRVPAPPPGSDLH